MVSLFVSFYFETNDDYGMYRYFNIERLSGKTTQLIQSSEQEILHPEMRAMYGIELRFSHWYVQIANLIFLSSNFQMDILNLRILMIFANISFWLWGAFVLYTALDVLIYASINILVNIVLSIPLILQRIPIKFDLEMEDIYVRFFSNYLSRLEFQILIKKCGVHLKRRFQVNTKIITEKNPFESLILFTNIPTDAKVIMLTEKKKICTVTIGQWIGVPEMLEVQQRFDDYERKMAIIDKKRGIERQITELRDHYKHSIQYFDITVKIIKVGDDPIEFLEFDYISLKKAFSNKEHGKMLENSLRSIWMHNYMKSMVKLDIKLKKAWNLPSIKSVSRGDDDLYYESESMPSQI